MDQVCWLDQYHDLFKGVKIQRIVVINALSSYTQGLEVHLHALILFGALHSAHAAIHELLVEDSVSNDELIFKWNFMMSQSSKRKRRKRS